MRAGCESKANFSPGTIKYFIVVVHIVSYQSVKN